MHAHVAALEATAGGAAHQRPLLPTEPPPPQLQQQPDLHIDLTKAAPATHTDRERTRDGCGGRGGSSASAAVHQAAFLTDFPLPFEGCGGEVAALAPARMQRLRSEWELDANKVRQAAVCDRSARAACVDATRAKCACDRSARAACVDATRALHV
eukprot:354093-Chlamydomonas_euryale.AAC.1